MHKYRRYIEAQVEKSSGLYCFYSFFLLVGRSVGGRSVVVAVELLCQFGCRRIVCVDSFRKGSKKFIDTLWF